MADDGLSGLRVAILVSDGFEQIELEEPRKALEEAGAVTSVVSPREGQVRGWKFKQWGDEVPVDASLEKASAEDFDALLLPSGVISPDKLRTMPKAVAFTKAFFDAGKPVAAICHGPWTLIEADVVHGRVMTSWPSLRTDLENTGAEWVNRPVVVDGNLLTSRQPDDIAEAFNPGMIDLFRSSARAGARGAA